MAIGRKQYRRGSITNWTVHVLVPCSDLAASWTVQDDEYHPDTLPDLTAALTALKITSHFHRTTLTNYKALIASIPPAPATIIMNLCDGTETDNRPGTSVLEELQRSGHAFTGADKQFNDVSCSKSIMKDLLQSKGVKVPAGCILPATSTPAQTTDLMQHIPFPAILKPDVSYGAIGVSCVHSIPSALHAIQQLHSQFGADSRIVVEEFVSGREFTALVVDDAMQSGICYPVLERIFDAGLKLSERFLSQDVYWNDKFHSTLAPECDQSVLQRVARDAYLAVGGNGYARVDMRMSETGEVYVLEVNALCGVSGGTDSSVGNILVQSGLTFEGLLVRFFEFAAKRAEVAGGVSSCGGDRIRMMPATRQGGLSC